MYPTWHRVRQKPLNPAYTGIIYHPLRVYYYYLTRTNFCHSRVVFGTFGRIQYGTLSSLKTNSTSKRVQNRFVYLCIPLIFWTSQLHTTIIHPSAEPLYPNFILETLWSWRFITSLLKRISGCSKSSGKNLLRDYFVLYSQPVSFFYP